MLTSQHNVVAEGVAKAKTSIAIVKEEAVKEEEVYEQEEFREQVSTSFLMPVNIFLITITCLIQH